jgi:hypothetical protein
VSGAARARAGAALLCLSVLSGPRPSSALPADGEPITTNDYGIDLHQGPVLAGTRVTGLGGAFVAIAEGDEGNPINPASPAVRAPWSQSHFDYDWGFGLTFPSALSNTDYYNSGRFTRLPSSQPTDFGGFVFLNFALNLQFGRWGFGLTTDLQRYALARAEDPTLGIQRERLLAQIALSRLQVAYGFGDGQLVVGIGARTPALSVINEVDQQELFSTVGSGVELGFLWRPNWQQFRVGGAFHSAVETAASGDRVVYQADPLNRLYLPERITLPWDVDLGLAVQLGPRPFNPRWVDPSGELEERRRFLAWRARERRRQRANEIERARLGGLDVGAATRAIDAELATEAALDELHLAGAETRLDKELARRYARLARFFVLISASLLITGPAREAVGVESFLERTVQRSGERVSYAPRLAVETEPIPHWLKLRAGTYIEPTRFVSNDKGARVHGTLGFDQKLLAWEVFDLFPDGTHWRASASIDAARSYFGWSVGIGVWR